MNAVDLLELCWSGEMASMGHGDGLACGPQGPLGVCIMCSGEHHAYLAWCVRSHPDFEVFSAKRHFGWNVAELLQRRFVALMGHDDGFACGFLDPLAVECLQKYTPWTCPNQL